MQDPKQIYRVLLKLYPARFREEYETPLARQFMDEYRAAASPWARSVLWLRALSDLACSIPVESARELRQDAGYAARIYRRKALVTGLALTALALAIGGATGVFSVLNALLIRSLPFHDPERLVDVPIIGVTLRDSRLILPPGPGFEVATYNSADMNLSRADQAARVHVAETSANFFAVLGVDPEFGRAFRADEDQPGKEGVAVIGYGLWQQMFGGDPRALGATIHVNGAPMTVVGVAPRLFDYPAKTAVWTPTVLDLERLGKEGVVFPRSIGRLPTGVTLARANQKFAVIAEAQRDPQGPKGAPVERLTSLRDRLAGPIRQASLVLLAVVGFVLLIACANVAQLLLSRITERRQEMAMRAALGASRARLVQQLITESILLTMTAAAAGFAVAWWAARLASSVQPAQLAAQDYSILDWRVLGFAVAVAIVTGVLFGVLPAFLIARTQPTAETVRAQAGPQGSGVSRTQRCLIAMQAVLTVMLVAGALTMGRSFLKLMGSDLGFGTQNVVAATISLFGSPYEANHQQQSYYRQVLDRLRAVPGVESAGAADFLPLTNQALMTVPVEAGPMEAAVPITITPDYFRTLGTRILDGRDFSDTDREGAELVAIVNEEFGRRSDSKARLVGRTVTTLFDKRPLKIVGVVQNTRFAPSNDPVTAQLFRPAAQHPAMSMTFVARVHGNAERYPAVCRDAIQQVDARVAVYGAMTLSQRLDEALAKPRFYTTAILFLSGFAMLLALIGIYGMAAYSISQRTHEIGVRIAVGASPARLRVALLRQSLLPMAVGMAAGVAGAIELGRFLQHLMSAAEPVGAGTCGVAALMLAITAALAVWRATARVLRVDPMRALRAD